MRSWFLLRDIAAGFHPSDLLSAVVRCNKLYHRNTFRTFTGLYIKHIFFFSWAPPQSCHQQHPLGIIMATITALMYWFLPIKNKKESLSCVNVCDPAAYRGNSLAKPWKAFITGYSVLDYYYHSWVMKYRRAAALISSAHYTDTFNHTELSD